MVVVGVYLLDEFFREHKKYGNQEKGTYLSMIDDLKLFLVIGTFEVFYYNF